MQRRVLAAGQDRRLDLQHGHVVVETALLPVEQLQSLGRLQVLGIAIDGVGEIRLGPLGVVEMVEPDLPGQVEQLAGL